MQRIDRIIQKLQSGDVTRYHTRPKIGQGQDIAQHCWRACMIALELWPDLSREALVYLLHHDNAELRLGDLPAMVKWEWEDLAHEYELAEAIVEKEMGIGVYATSLTAEEYRKVKIADMLELVFHCHEQIEMGNQYALEGWNRGVSFLHRTFAEFPEYNDFEPVIRRLSCIIHRREPLP